MIIQAYLKSPIRYFVITLCLLACVLCGQAQTKKAATPTPAIDFSHAGYGGGGVALPNLPATLLVAPTGGDDTEVLQAALDQVGALPQQPNGFRGVVQLAGKTFRIAGQLQLGRSGVVLRGSGQQATTLLATGRTRRALVVVGRFPGSMTASAIPVTDAVVPAGSGQLTLANLEGLQVGDRVVVTRPSTKAWSHDLGMDTLRGTFPELRYHWPAGSRDLVWERKILALDAAKKQVTLDAPITTALEQRYGGGTLARVNAYPPLEQVGVENLVIQSEYDFNNPKDEEHAWFGVVLDHVEDAWVQGVTGRHLVSSLVQVGPRGRRITVQHCRNEQPRSEPGGYRRLAFLVQGQQVLVQHCQSDSGINDFAVGFCAAGPNVFLNCEASNALGASGSYESWAAGVLYENVRVKGHDLRLTYDPVRAQAGGWTAANSIIWNSQAREIKALGPAGAPNQVVRSREPLYEKQLTNRLGAAARRALAGTAPVYAEPLDTAATFVFSPGSVRVAPPPPPAPLQIRNGRFVVGDKTLWGGAVNDAWWLGQTSPANALDAGVSITRFVPGLTGPGLTEDLPALAARVAAQGTPFYQSGPAIWYDRRRDDHSIVERPDANVWAAFYELPWARSGQGKAWDGLSKYDLTRYNPWYFERTKAFAQLCDQHGLVFYHHLYNNHNLLETAAHWVDFPWRPANNINETGLPEPMPLETRNRIHVANAFYDVSNPKLRELHRAYIFHVLDQLGAARNIIFGLSFQYSGPLAFQQFFGETVAEWEKQHNRRVRLVLDTSKDVTDGILADPERARQVAVIDMRYWHYLPDGTLWAPRGGQNRAFRELHPKEFGDPSTPELVYRQVREYRDQYPDKAIVAWHSGVGPIPALMAGGAQVLMRNPTAGHGQGREVDRHPVDKFVQDHLAQVLAEMVPRDHLLADGARNWALADGETRHLLLYSLAGAEINLAQKLKGKSYTGLWFDPRTGQTQRATLPARFKKGTRLTKPDDQNWLLYLKSGN